MLFKSFKARVTFLHRHVSIFKAKFLWDFNHMDILIICSVQFLHFKITHNCSKFRKFNFSLLIFLFRGNSRSRHQQHFYFFATYFPECQIFVAMSCSSIVTKQESQLASLKLKIRDYYSYYNVF